MDRRPIRRLLCAAILLTTVAVDSNAKNVAEMVAGLLRDVVTGYSPPHADDGKYHVVVLYNNTRLNDAAVRDDEVVVRQEKIALVDVYAQLAAVDAAERYRIQCVIMVDLEPQQVIAAEHFARERKVVIASVLLPFSAEIDRGSVPFIFDIPQQVPLTRSAAVHSYGLRLTSLPPKGAAELTRESRFQNVDHCPPMLADDHGAYGYVACHDNAFERMNDKNSWRDGLLDLDAAVLGRFDEQYDGRAYPRGWGLKGYHPHIGLADYLSRYGNCSAAQRELKIALLPRDTTKKNDLEKRIASQCAAAPMVGAANLNRSILARYDPNDREPELRSPFHPALVWRDSWASR